MTVLTEDTFVISDTHFGHDNMIAFEPLRASLAGLQPTTGDPGLPDRIYRRLAEAWNSAVGRTDTVLHLGDFTSEGDMLNMERKIKKYSGTLNGRIILVKGNHDAAWPPIYEGAGIEFLNDVIIDRSGMAVDRGIISGAIGLFNGTKVLFSHYPVIDLYSETVGSSPDGSVHDAFSEEILYLKNFFDLNKCDINVHGHIHEKINRYSNLVDVSPDNVGHAPVRIRELLPLNAPG